MDSTASQDLRLTLFICRLNEAGVDWLNSIWPTLATASSSSGTMSQLPFADHLIHFEMSA